ncbi:MAG: biotin--[acetyl-CoA-carboxylase] ligase [Spirochaetia bacterium]|nr:biotin--[acetyl-CoA-carboxylase] ligase [Spirochaetia bacterium]
MNSNSDQWLILESVDSTNSYALAQKQLASGTVILAKEQTSGRGRMGREWKSTAGNSFLFSGILNLNLNELPLERISFIPLLTGLAAVKACRSFFVNDSLKKFSVKWPNDVYMESEGHCGKLGGVLIESEQIDEALIRCVIGVGLNWKGRVSEVSDAEIQPASLFSYTEMDRFDFAPPLIREFNQLMELLAINPVNILSEIRTCFYLDQKLVKISDKIFRVTGINDRGSLLIVSPEDGSEREISSISEKIIPLTESEEVMQ